MNYKKLEQLTELYKEIRSLDDEIIRLNKTAMKIAESGSMVDLKISIVNNSLEFKTPVLDDEGSLITNKAQNPVSGIQFYFTTSPGKPTKDKVKADLKERVSDTSALQIMAILLSEKNDRRAKLIHEIKYLS